MILPNLRHIGANPDIHNQWRLLGFWYHKSLMCTMTVVWLDGRRVANADLTEGGLHGLGKLELRHLRRIYFPTRGMPGSACAGS